MDRFEDLTPEQLRAEADRREADKKPPFVGESIDRGIYRVTYAPVEAEFDHSDSAEDAACHACWNTDSELPIFEVEKVRSTVTKETHPWICGSCERYVTDNLHGRCGNCSETNWADR